MKIRSSLVLVVAIATQAPAMAAGPTIRFEPVGPGPTARPSGTPTSVQNKPIDVFPHNGSEGPIIRRTGPRRQDVVRQAAPPRQQPQRAAAPRRAAWPYGPGQLDERPLWALVRAKRWAELRRMVALARAAKPAWQPPAAMFAEMRQEEVHAKIREAKAKRQPAQIIALARQYPELFEYNHLDLRWEWIGALAADGHPDQALAALLTTLEAPLSEHERVATLQKSVAWIGPVGQGSLIHLELLRPHSPTLQAELEKMEVDARLARLGKALAAHQDKVATALAAEAAPDVIRRRDAHLAIGIGWLHRRNGDTDLARQWYDRAAAWAPRDASVIAELAQAGERDTARRLLDGLQADDPRRSFIDRALRIADANDAYVDKRYDEALDLLDRAASQGVLAPDAQLLRIRTLLALERFREAEQAAHGLLPGTPARAEALAAVALGRATTAIADQRYADALKALEAPGASASRDARLLRAWTLYNLGDARRAAPQFATLFDEHPDAKSAEGLYFAATKAERKELITSRKSVPALARVLEEQQGQAAIASGDFGLAYQLAPRKFPELSGYTLPSVTLGLSRRDRTGDPGLSRFQVTREPIANARMGITATDELRLGVDRLIMDTGAAGDKAIVGSAPVDGGPVPAGYNATAAIGIEPRISYAHLAGSGLRAQVGITPSGGPLAPAWTGELGYDARDDFGTTSIGAFARPVYDSRLSMIGMIDPYTGKAWGRVTSLGLDLGRSLTLSGSDTLNGHLVLDALTGDSVADNDHTAIAAGWRRALPHPFFSYLAWGVDGSLESYRRNLSGFTLGNGGYFSPQLQGRIRLALEGRTLEIKPFMLSGSLGVGPGYAWSEPDPYYPLTPDGRTTAGIDQTSVYYDANLRAVTHLTDWAQGGCSITLYRNADYEEHVIALFTRVLFGPRGIVVGGDLEP